MIVFKVTDRGPKVSDTIRYKCVCGAQNFRGLFANQDSRKFKCWQCDAILPAVSQLLNFLQTRKNYFNTGLWPSHINHEAP